MAARSSAIPSKPVGSQARKADTVKTVGTGRDKESGVHITREEVEQAFAFFDVSGTKVLRPRDLKARLSAFYPHMTNKEYRFLISEPNFTGRHAVESSGEQHHHQF